MTANRNGCLDVVKWSYLCEWSDQTNIKMAGDGSLPLLCIPRATRPTRVTLGSSFTGGVESFCCILWERPAELVPGATKRRTLYSTIFGATKSILDRKTRKNMDQECDHADWLIY